MSEGEWSAETPRHGFEAEAPEGASAEEQLSEDELDALLSEVEAAEVTTDEDEVIEEAVEVLDEIDVLRSERDDYLDALRRLQADFENYRKRTVRQQTELLGRAAESLIERLLPILDALDLALAHSGDEEASVGALGEALQQIGSLARDTLSKEGLERIDEAGVAFDPTIHDAVAHLSREDDEAESGVVVDEVLRAGYQLKGRVVRPAMVRVRG